MLFCAGELPSCRHVRYCADATTITTLDSTGDVGSYNSIVLGADDNPVIAYYDATNKDLKVAACSNPTCTSATITTVASSGWVGSYNSIALGADNNPIIAFIRDGGDVRVIACLNPTCTSSILNGFGNAVFDGVDAASQAGNTSIAIGADDKPIISWARTGHDLYVAVCGDPTCSDAAFSAEPLIVCMRAMLG